MNETVSSIICRPARFEDMRACAAILKDARCFYSREGFSEIRRTNGDNEEGLPDIPLECRAVR